MKRVICKVLVVIHLSGFVVGWLFVLGVVACKFVGVCFCVFVCVEYYIYRVEVWMEESINYNSY